MKSTVTNAFLLTFFLCSGLISSHAQAQTVVASASATAPATAVVRIRAMIEKIDSNNMAVKDRRGEIVNLVLSSQSRDLRGVHH